MAGTLSAGNAGAPGITGPVTVSDGGTLNIDNVTLAGICPSLSGSGAGGVGALTGTGSAAYSGSVTLAADAGIGATTATDHLTLGE